MRTRIEAQLSDRIEHEISNKNPLKYLKGKNISELMDIAIPIIYLFTRRQSAQDPNTLVEMACAIGRAIRRKYKLSKNSASAVRTGAFILWSFESHEIIRIRLAKSKGKHATYTIEVTDHHTLQAMYDEILLEKIERAPLFSPAPDWKDAWDGFGNVLVKTSSLQVLTSLNAKDQPIVFEAVNKSQRIGWKINKRILEIAKWAFKVRADAFMDIWEQTDVEARNSKIRESGTILRMAEKIGDRTFYHRYYLDFRGRKYPSTAYLHEQGSDLSVGLLKRAEGHKLGETGFDWMRISLANTWGGPAGRADGRKTDKIPLADRIQWVDDNIEMILRCAQDPEGYQEWMSADKPWQFLAACFEMSRLSSYLLDPSNKIQDFESALEVYIDGSNNGSQHLVALTRDAPNAPHVNLTPQEFPGDLYEYIAEHVWNHINKRIDEMGHERVARLENLIDEVVHIRRCIDTATPGTEDRKFFVDELAKKRAIHSDDMVDAGYVFWGRITDIKHRRKVVKRNVMTLPYGGTPYGLGEQQISDARKHGIDALMYLEHKWGMIMGRGVYAASLEALRLPMGLLRVFEEAGERAERAGEFLSWKTPITNFPVQQNYEEGIWKRVYVQYGPPGNKTSTGYYDNTLQLHVCFTESRVPSKRKQAQGASPNAIHSLDAAHLMLTTHMVDFPISTVHDSYGCLYGQMTDLYVKVREAFVMLHEAQPLESILVQMGMEDKVSTIERGQLDLSQILISEYAFA